MKHLEVMTHKQDGRYYLMIRNKNTAYALGEYMPNQYKYVCQLVEQYDKYDADKLLGEYINAKRKNLFCLRYEYSFKDQRNAYVRQVSGEELRLLNAKRQTNYRRAYCVCVKVPREVILVQKPLRKDCESILKTWRDEYTMEELIEKVKELLTRHQSKAN